MKWAAVSSVKCNRCSSLGRLYTSCPQCSRILAEEAAEMRDRDVRLALAERLRAEHSDDLDTLILNELGLCQGNSRVDLATVNGFINGYEIKSDSDTLERLPRQIEAYNQVLDFVTIVVGSAHLADASAMVPKWWGIVEAKPFGNGVLLREKRQAKRNRLQNPYALVQLLWRDEALAVLADRGLEKGMLSKPRQVIWRRLADSLSPQELNDVVRAQLKSRERWRSDQPQMLSDD